jgi:predicted dehydrogenase
MNKGNLSRRGFMQQTMAAAMATGLPAWYARQLAAEEAKAAEKEKPVGANDKIVMGLIGCGGQGNHNMNQARAQKGIECVAVCDVDAKRRKESAAKIGKDVKDYEDYRELLGRKDINAVIIATPDHWHTLCAIEALQRGKDIYCEKPLTLTVAEGIALTKVAASTGHIFQVGSQQRSDARFRLACELVRNGRLGQIKTIETMIGINPTGGPFKTSPPPEELNWDFWLGSTPKVDYVKERCHYQFRWWYEYSGGKMTDWGAHHNDIAQWALGMDNSGPIAVEAEGAEPSKEPNSYNCHPTFKVTYTYGNGTKLICTGKNDNDNGVRFEGEDGKWIFVNRGTIRASDKSLLEPMTDPKEKLYVSGNHMGNFIEGIRTRKACICPASVGHRSVTVCHIGVIALRTGKKLKWDPKAENFDDEMANKMLSRPIREPWKLEV